MSEQRYISRDANGKINGDYSGPQSNTDPEPMAIDDPEFMAYAGTDLDGRKAVAVREIESINRRLFQAIYPTAGIVQEYQAAELQARTFLLAGCVGEVPTYVQIRMDAAGRTAEQATGDIIAKANLAALVVSSLSRLRQTHRRAILDSADDGAFELAFAAALEAFGALQAQVQASL